MLNWVQSFGADIALQFCIGRRFRESFQAVFQKLLNVKWFTIEQMRSASTPIEKSISMSKFWIHIFSSKPLQRF